MREDRVAFAEFFGSDELILAPDKTEDRINADYRQSGRLPPGNGPAPPEASGGPTRTRPSSRCRLN